MSPDLTDPCGSNHWSEELSFIQSFPPVLTGSLVTGDPVTELWQNYRPGLFGSASPNSVLLQKALAAVREVRSHCGRWCW